MHVSAFVFFAFFLASCTATLSETGLQEKAVIEKAAAGKPICWGMGVWNFTHLAVTVKPSQDCLYSAAPIKILNVTRPVQDSPILRVRQALPDGYLVEGLRYAQGNGTGIYKTNLGSDNVVFIHKADEKDVIDGSFLDEPHVVGLYQYVGIYQYETAFGMKSVYAFKKMSSVQFPAE